MPQKPRFFYWFLLPSTLTAFGLVLSLLAILQYSVRSYVPGSLEVGGPTLDNFFELLKPLYAKAFLETVQISLYTAVFTLLIGYPLAYALIRAQRAWCRSLILIIAITPLFLGEVVRTYAWIIVLGTTGFINSLLMGIGLIDRPLRLMFTQLGVVIALVHVTLPIMVLMLAAGLSHIDRNYERAAHSLGAGPVRAFLTVTLPLSMPGIIAGTLTAFAWTFSAFATPQLIGGGRVNTISTLVYQLGFSSLNFPFAASLSIAGLILTALVLWGVSRLSRSFESLGGGR
ncbi:ABC transporter permease [Halotalea alkalilenta]|uniref:ABC transporter permease n=1 Tax=Halotalea alkalilenta TaxID=376489 RepID=UPI00048751B1|nr:ABC transporter permease [Halotalea alkalilenta]